MHVSGGLGTTARVERDSDPRLTAVRPGDSSREAADPEPTDLTLYLVEVPEGWELRSWHGHGIVYSGLADPLRLAQGWVEGGNGRILITRSARG